MNDSLIPIFIGIIGIFAGSLNQGLTGFGMALVSIPFLITSFPPQVVVPVLLCLGFFQNIIVLYDARRYVQLKRVWILIVSSLFGIPFGTFVLKTLDPDLMKTIIGSVIAIFAASMLFGLRKPMKNEKIAQIPIGYVGGVLSGGTAMSGPPAILFFSNQGMLKNVFRANILTYFTVLNIATILIMTPTGLINAAVLRISLYFLPAMIVGAYAGIKLSRRINEKVFRRIALIVVLIGGIFSVVNGLID